MIIEYSSNNSGGDWWLTDEDWKALEDAGWKVQWHKDDPPDSPFARSISEDGRWLGALAGYASIDAETPADAMRSFEKATGKDVSDEGCNCCGPPHSFSWGGEEAGVPRGYASGEDCLPHLFPDKKIPSSVREAMES
jgi:hypothetical protein